MTQKRATARCAAAFAESIEFRTRDILSLARGRVRDYAKGGQPTFAAHRTNDQDAQKRTPEWQNQVIAW